MQPTRKQQKRQEPTSGTALRAFLVSTIRSVNARLERYRRVQLTLSHGKQTADRELRQIVEACLERKEDTAAELVYGHIMSACQSLLEHLPGKTSV
ncbi:GntR family transcriptional regulator domain-containing protein (plasmid) [Rhizobium etli]|uniref:GntR family transcriptional regulator domain-containing protein n=1 Tax=Rhizobium etli TaxID=29449 RepID=A0AAN1BP07_RHIET|nr:GntR family transcriptional regulator domain-containing protein [Rhizobium etli bv. mimosae str. Mim1]ARQ14191.1 GntR family transcriptional regulator domain-containing protein [Rhizobium etli]